MSRLCSALLWCGAFTFACAWYLPSLKLLRGLPPTSPVAIGRVTIEGVSKSRDYAAAAIFYLLVPLLAVLFRAAGERLHLRLLRPVGTRVPPALRLATAALLTFPFLLAPFFFLTTRKELWGIALPPVIGAAAVCAVVAFHTRYQLRRLFDPELRPFHWLILFEGAAWILFRYLATGKRIAHIPTLFLEGIFIAFFLGVFWLLAAGVAHLVSLLFERDRSVALASVAAGASPLLVLPIAGLGAASPAGVISIALPLTALSVAVAVSRRARWSSAVAWNLAAFIAAPILIFCLTYASTAHASQWIDIFHRGESLGPASDYLRGKVPYRDVFVLHGMLENGLLDSWLMRMFGRDAGVALGRLVVISALTMPMLWLIAVIALRSIPLAALSVLLGYVISADNQRALPQLFVVTALLIAIRRRSRIAVFAAGAFAGFALFYSFDMGLYSVAGGLISVALLGWMSRDRWWIALFAAGVIFGAGPFLVYLASQNAAGEFFRISFGVVPAVIDAAWSLPFPDLASPFRDFSARTLADFILTEKFRFILNPLVLGIAATVLLGRLLRSRESPRMVDQFLLTLLIFAVLTQRSALGRADFPHQYFSAFLLPPILAILGAFAAGSLRSLWTGGSVPQRVLLAVLVAVLFPVVLAVLWVPDLLNARLDAAVQYRARIRGVYEPRGAEVEERLKSVNAVARQMTRPDEPVFDFSNQPALYFFTDRANPTRFYQVPILSPLAAQIEVIEDLARARPKLVFRRSPEGFDIFDGVENDVRAPVVAAFLDDHYAFERNVRGIEIWRPVASRPRRPLSDYRRMFVRPSNPSLAPKQRLIFPGFGAVAGIDAPDWRSDLVLYNPHTVPVEIRARYVWSSGSRDRRVRIHPRAEVVLNDAVRTFFEAPDQKGGTLWLEFAADRRPLARAATYADSRRASTSVNAPLFEPDAATGLSLLNELTAGPIQEGEKARVDIGVINAGPAPAEFRILATDVAGVLVGTAHHGTTPEEGSYLLMDAREQLGIPPLQPVTFHVRLLSGRAIGYGSIVSMANATRQIIPAIPTHAP